MLQEIKGRMEIGEDDFDAREDAARAEGKPSQETDRLDSIDLTPELRAELLDPESWGKILELYSRTIKLAVALIDADGQLVGTCHNPQPIWSLARNAKPRSNGVCLFCLETSPQCSAAADALRTESLALAHDQAGFAHAALPLTLGGRHVGTLLCGQVLNRYPEPLPLQRAARQFGLSPQQLWHLAVQQVPVSRASLTVYGDLLCVVGQAFLRDRYNAILRRRSEDLVRKLNLDLKHFSYAASHDLQEPLRAVTIYTQLLAREYMGKLDPKADQFIAYALEGANRIETLLRDLREYWLVNERLEPWASIDCVLVLNKAIQALRVPIEESGASVTHGLLPKLVAEEVSLTMLFQNLVGNAIKYRRPGMRPSVHISALKQANSWCFSVKDNGIGIEAKHVEEIFAPFRRLHGRDYPGSGIGLALCSKIVERYGGRLWAESTEGQGSTFCFTIPARVA